MFNQYYRSNPKANQNKVKTNEQIRVPQVRLIASDGQQLGIVQTKDALLKAQDEGLDLVEVAPLAKPPVCRIMDVGKYLYSITRKEKESRKKQKLATVKEIKITPKIEEHDYQTKLRNGRRFLERGDKLKLSMMFRGREITHTELGKKILERYTQDVSDIAELERNGRLEGNMIHLYFSPMPAAKRNAVKKAQAAAAQQTPKSHAVPPSAETQTPAQ